MPWVRGCFIDDGILHFFKCHIYSTIDKKPKLMPPKLDTLIKHEGEKMAKKDMSKLGMMKGEHGELVQIINTRIFLKFFMLGGLPL